YVDNVVQANILVAAAPTQNIAGRVFNIATGNRFTLNEVIENLKALTGFSGTIQYDAPRAGDVKHSLADISAARQAFGYQPTVDFKEGLRRTVEWYRAQMEVTRQLSHAV